MLNVIFCRGQQTDKGGQPKQHKQQFPEGLHHSRTDEQDEPEAKNHLHDSDAKEDSPISTIIPERRFDLKEGSTHNTKKKRHILIPFFLRTKGCAIVKIGFNKQ